MHAMAELTEQVLLNQEMCHQGKSNVCHNYLSAYLCVLKAISKTMPFLQTRETIHPVL